MPQTVVITLTTAGADTGPFDLYSNVDGFLVPFENNVPKLNLQAGYLSSLVPDGATVVRVQSDNVSCDNFIDLNIVPTTTTTSSTSTTSTTTSTSTSTTTTSTTTESPCDDPPYNYFTANSYELGSCTPSGSELVALSTAHSAVIGRYYCPCADTGFQYELVSSASPGFAVILTNTSTETCLTGNCFS